MGPAEDIWDDAVFGSPGPSPAPAAVEASVGTAAPTLDAQEALGQLSAADTAALNGVARPKESVQAEELKAVGEADSAAKPPTRAALASAPSELGALLGDGWPAEEEFQAIKEADSAAKPQAAAALASAPSELGALLGDGWRAEEELLTPGGADSTAKLQPAAAPTLGTLLGDAWPVEELQSKVSLTTDEPPLQPSPEGYADLLGMMDDVTEVSKVGSALDSFEDLVVKASQPAEPLVQRSVVPASETLTVLTDGPSDTGALGNLLGVETEKQEPLQRTVAPTSETLTVLTEGASEVRALGSLLDEEEDTRDNAAGWALDDLQVNSPKEEPGAKKVKAEAEDVIAEGRPGEERLQREQDEPEAPAHAAKEAPEAEEATVEAQEAIVDEQPGLEEEPEAKKVKAEAGEVTPEKQPGEERSQKEETHVQEVLAPRKEALDAAVESKQEAKVDVAEEKPEAREAQVGGGQPGEEPPKREEHGTEAAEAVPPAADTAEGSPSEAEGAALKLEALAMLQSYKDMIVLIYQEHNPNKVGDLDAMFGKYREQVDKVQDTEQFMEKTRDRLEKLLQLTCKKYGVEPQEVMKQSSPEVATTEQLPAQSRPRDEPPDQALVIREAILAVYHAHNPQKVSQVDSLMEKYKGREGVLYGMICEKYQVQADPALLPAAQEPQPAPAEPGAPAPAAEPASAASGNWGGSWGSSVFGGGGALGGGLLQSLQGAAQGVREAAEGLREKVERSFDEAIRSEEDVYVLAGSATAKAVEVEGAVAAEVVDAESQELQAPEAEAARAVTQPAATASTAVEASQGAQPAKSPVQPSAGAEGTQQQQGVEKTGASGEEQPGTSSAVSRVPAEVPAVSAAAPATELLGDSEPPPPAPAVDATEEPAAAASDLPVAPTAEPATELAGRSLPTAPPAEVPVARERSLLEAETAQGDAPGLEGKSGAEPAESAESADADTARPQMEPPAEPAQPPVEERPRRVEQPQPAELPAEPGPPPVVPAELPEADSGPAPVAAADGRPQESMTAKANEEQPDPFKAYRERITAIYQQHNPGKVGEVGNLLEKYREHPGGLYRSICLKYNVEPEPGLLPPPDEEPGVTRGSADAAAAPLSAWGGGLLSSGLRTLQTLHGAAEGFREQVERTFDEAIRSEEDVSTMKVVHGLKDAMEKGVDRHVAAAEPAVLAVPSLPTAVAPAGVVPVAVTPAAVGSTPGVEAAVVGTPKEESAQPSEQLLLQLQMQAQLQAQAQLQEHMEALQADRDRTVRELKTLRLEHGNLKNEGTKMSRRVQAVEERMKVAVADARRFEGQVAELERAKESLHAQVTKLTARAEKAEAQSTEQRGEVRRLNAELEKARKELQGGKRQLEAEHQALQQRQREQGQRERQLEESLQAAHKEREQLVATATSLSAQLQQAHNAADATERSHQAQLHEAQLSSDEKQRRIEALELEFAGQNLPYQQRIAVLEAQLAQQEQERSEREVALQREREAEQARLEARRAELQRREELQERRAQEVREEGQRAQRAVSEAAQHRRRASEADGARELAEQAREAVEAELRLEAAKRRSAEQRVAELQESVADLTRRQAAAAQLTNSPLVSNAASAGAASSSAAAEAPRGANAPEGEGNSPQSAAASEVEARRLRAQVEALTRQRDSLEKESATLQNRIAALEQERANSRGPAQAQAQVPRLEQRFEAALQAIGRLQEELETAQEQREAYKAQCHQLLQGMDNRRG